MTLTLTTITRNEALDLMRRGAQAKRAEIEESIRDLRSQLNRNGTDSRGWTPGMRDLKDAVLGTMPKRRKFSPAARKRMAEAQRARWAKRKAA